MSEERTARSLSYDAIAELYNVARPGYPDALFEDLVTLGGIAPGARLLEIGCGPGQATAPLAQRGFRIVALEPGARLAALARERCRKWPTVEVAVTRLEDWSGEIDAFDLAFAATSFHWLEPAAAYPIIARALKPNAVLAPFANIPVWSEVSAPFLEAARSIYEEDAPGLVTEHTQPFHPDRPPDITHRLEWGGYFAEFATHFYPWSATYDTNAFAKLLQTQSGIRRLPTSSRDRLVARLADLIDREFGGQITRSYLAALSLARRVTPGPTDD